MVQGCEGPNEEEADLEGMGRLTASGPNFFDIEAPAGGGLRICAEDLSDDARRERAADVATKLLGALGVGDESESDDSVT